MATPPSEQERSISGLSAGSDAVSHPAGNAPSGASAEPSPLPFVWQRGLQLLLLDDDDGEWVMAELRFEPDLCRYVEIRRATYTWVREAAGAVISRALASGEEAARDSARVLQAWLATYHNSGHLVPTAGLVTDPAPLDLQA